MENPYLVMAFTAAFTAWAGVVGFIGYGLRQDIRNARQTMQEGMQGIRDDLKEESKKLNEYIVHTEKRLENHTTRLDAVERKLASDC